MKVPTIIIPNWIIAVQMAAATRALEASVFFKFVTSMMMEDVPLGGEADQ